MPEEVTFLDLVALIKIKPDTTVEKYGGMINSSLFDAANVLGTLSQKKLISFTTAMPGQNPITLTDQGKQLINDAQQRSNTEFDHLDLAILTQMSTGKSNPVEIGKLVNVRPTDLAMHMYKMVQQDYATYEFRSGMVSAMLTEKGFAQVKVGMPMKPPMPAQNMQQMPQMQQPMAKQQQKPMMAADPMMQGQEMKPAGQSQAMPMEGQAQAPGAPMANAQPEMKAKASKGSWAKGIIVLVVIIIIVGALAYLKIKNIPPL